MRCCFRQNQGDVDGNCLPTLALCAVLLGHAATIPPAAILILVVLLLANLAQNVASCLLLHTGFFRFREIARLATFLVVAMAAMTGLVLATGVDIVGFIGGYAVVYVMGAALYVAYVVRGPIRTAAIPATMPKVASR